MENLNSDNISIKKQIQFYFFGLIFCLILTIIPFFLAIKKIFSIKLSIVMIVLCSILQVYIHLRYFLHLKFLKVNYWTIIFLFFSIIVIFIIMTGSIWIMYNLKHHVLFYLCI